jgi:hypothetical protein
MWPRTANQWKLSRNVSLALLCLHTVVLGEPISAHTHVNLDTHASAEYAEFIRAIAVPTALAETPPGDFVKFLRIGKNENGEVVVRGIGLLPINSHAGADPGEMVEVLVIAHVHHKLMNQTPVREDALTVRALGVPNFVISSVGRRIWEVGIVGGKDMYRDIGSKKAGAWTVLE